MSHFRQQQGLTASGTTPSIAIPVIAAVFLIAAYLLGLVGENASIAVSSLAIASYALRRRRPGQSRIKHYAVSNPMFSGHRARARCLATAHLTVR